MNHYDIYIRPFGQHAILIEWPNEVKEDILEDILQFMAILKEKMDLQAWELVPAYNSLTLIRRDGTIDFEAFQKQLRAWYDEDGTPTKWERFLWRFPVCYDLEFGVDLAEVSEQLGKSISEIIDLHTTHKYTVYGIGFLPGFMYLGGLPQALEVPRKATPRLRVAKGSVGIAAKQTGIYPQDSPGGWNIIGNCSVPMFNVDNESPCLVSVGDKVQFYAIERAEYELHLIEAQVGIYKLEKIPLHA